METKEKEDNQEMPADAATTATDVGSAGSTKAKRTRTFNHAKYLLTGGDDMRKYNPANRSLGHIDKLLNPEIPELEPAIKECVKAHKKIVNDGLLRLGSRLRKGIEVWSGFKFDMRNGMYCCVGLT